MKKIITFFSLFLAVLLIIGIFYFFSKNYGFLTSTEVKYYKARFEKSENYYKAKYYDTVPNYYKANPKNAPNYVNAEENPPKNYYKSSTKNKSKSKGEKTMEAIKSGFKK